jgi:hypothetical protein
MGNIVVSYGTPTAITITLASLASSATAGRASASVQNASNYLDALVFVRAKAAVATPANDKCIYVFAYGSLDEASPQFGDQCTGADAGITFDNPTQLRLIGIVNLSASGAACKAGPFSVAAAFGGILPKRWGIAVRNYSGMALSATGTDHDVKYQGVVAASA